MTHHQNFKINTGNYLGIDHATYKNKLLEIALVQPAKYFAIRENVLRNVKTNAISKMYDTFYKVMSEETLEDGTNAAAPVDLADGVAIGLVFKPSYPNQSITEFALGAAKTLDKICDECIEIIIPMNYRDLAESRARKGEAERIL